MISITSSAAQEARRLMERENKPNMGLRIGVKGGGCSGMTYVLELTDLPPKQHDSVLEQEGIKILIDAKSNLHLDGTTVDFKSAIMGGGFEFRNPNAKHSCGCGTSFSA